MFQANECMFIPGEIVQILEDRSEVVKLQEGSGGWNEDMIEVSVNWLLSYIIEVQNVSLSF